MGSRDANPALSAFAVTIGAIAGIALGVLLDLSLIGVLLAALAGVLIVGFAASALGIVGERDPERTDDLPPHYHDY